MTDFVPVKEETLTADELDRVAGGIIIVGGIQLRFAYALERIAMPQPLPPKVILFGR